MHKSRAKSRSCTSAGRVSASILLTILAISTPVLASLSGKAAVAENSHHESQQYQLLPAMPPSVPSSSGQQEFSLRHIFHHGAYLDPGLHRRKDIYDRGPLRVLYDDGVVSDITQLIAQSRPMNIQRLKDRRHDTIDTILSAAQVSSNDLEMLPSAWAIDEIPGPDITDKATVLSLARMSLDAYKENENSTGWQDIGERFNRTADLGWENDGLRGHVYASADNSTIVIGIKGTNKAVFDGDGTTTNDKVNDNLFASCCCAQQGGYEWKSVCNCATSTYTCNQTCLVGELKQENRYYAASRALFGNVTALYPNSEVWITGHSLGGLVSGLLGLTYGVPVVTFQAVPDALAAQRLGLPSPPGSISGAPQTRAMTGAYHFGHNADPVYMGSCNSGWSSCSLAGYAFEARCHTGQICEYDVVKDNGTRVSMWSHPIEYAIEYVYKAYEDVPACKADPDCVDCYLWEFYESHSSTSSVSSTSTTSRIATRTETCKTPGWWGCLDETTTTVPPHVSTSTTVTTTSTSTCKTKGWFGCLDETKTSAPVTSTIVTTTSTSSTSTTTCKTPGWFGRCNDIATTSSQVSTPAASTAFEISTSLTSISASPTITSPPKFLG